MCDNLKWITPHWCKVTLQTSKQEKIPSKLEGLMSPINCYCNGVSWKFCMGAILVKLNAVLCASVKKVLSGAPLCVTKWPIQSALYGRKIICSIKVLFSFPLKLSESANKIITIASF